MIIVVVDTPSSVEINAGGSRWRPIQDGGCADTSASVYEASTCILSMGVTARRDTNVNNNGGWRRDGNSRTFY